MKMHFFLRELFCLRVHACLVSILLPMSLCTCQRRLHERREHREGQNSQIWTMHEDEMEENATQATQVN